MLTIRSSIQYRVTSAFPTDRLAVLVPLAGADDLQRLSDRLQTWGLSKAAAGAARQRLLRQEFKAKPGDVSLITDLAAGTVFFVFGVSADKDQRFESRGPRQVSVALGGMRKLVEAVQAEKPGSLVLDLADGSLWQTTGSLYAARSAGQMAAHLVQALELAYTPLPKQVKAYKADPVPTTVTLLVADAETATVTAAVERERILAAAGNLVRILTQLPANILNLDHYEALLTEIAADDPQLTLQVWNQAALSEAGAGCLVAVGRTALEPPRVARLSYTPVQAATATAAIVGKGVVYDTGGLSIKPSKYMLGMHDDMSGSAVAAAMAWAAAKLQTPYAVQAFLGLVENAIGPNAYRPGDILTAMNGKTVEVIDTDAEGRLVLADTLVLAQQEAKPDLLMDFATLTGSCLRALGDIASGICGNREDLYPLAVQAGYDTGDRVWPFPNWPEYADAIESKVADIRQCSPDAGPDVQHSFCFLNEFVSPDVPWLHVDMSSVRNDEGLGASPAGFTGFGARYGLAVLERIFAK
ncbi:MAG: leucyl aminopeptidase family protein [Candidatus Sericytochromatia bacterium]|nr:leucyl aminopeptidase family protein [Candidatus Sericytochromatia bacterium]